MPFLPKKAPFSKMAPQGHRFSTLFALGVKLWNCFGNMCFSAHFANLKIKWLYSGSENIWVCHYTLSATGSGQAK